MTFDIRREREHIRDGVILKSNYIVVIKLAIQQYENIYGLNFKVIFDLMLTKQGFNCNISHD